MKKTADAIRLTRAVDLMRVPGTRLMLMHCADGDHHYVVPGGRIDRRDAEKIMQRPDVHQFDDGLFPNNPQSWRLGEHAAVEA